MKIGLGTQNYQGPEGLRLCKYAFDIGYRIFDTALAYNNQELLRKFFDRLDKTKIKIISKVTSQHLNNHGMEGCLDLILSTLNIDYLDILLIHAPKGIDHERALYDMQFLQHKRKIIHYGLSNYTIKHLNRLKTKSLKPEILQVEIHPFLSENELIEYCNAHEIKILAHTALAHGFLKDDPILFQLSQEVGCTIPQLTLSWAIGRGITPIMSSSHEQHLLENTKIISEKLSADIIKRINYCNKNLRICNSPVWAEFD